MIRDSHNGFKLLVVMNYRPDGGLTAAVMQLVASLRSEGFIVDLMSTYGNFYDRIQKVNRIVKSVAYYNTVICSGAGYYGFFPILIGFLTAKAYKKRVIIDFHEGYPAPFLRYGGYLFKLLVKNTPVVAASGYLYSLLQRLGMNVINIPYHFHYGAFPKRMNNFEWDRKFLWVGRFEHMYDPETFLKAAKEVLAKEDNAEFHCFGAGPLLASLKRVYAHSKIVFHGFISREKLLKKYQNFSVLINTSFGDNFPVRLVEAAYNELLVLSAKGGGTATIYRDDECVFFNKGDYKRLAQYLMDILHCPDLYNSYRVNMNEKIKTFTWNNVRAQWLGLLSPDM